MIYLNIWLALGLVGCGLMHRAGSEQLDWSDFIIVLCSFPILCCMGLITKSLEVINLEKSKNNQYFWRKPK